MKKWLIEGIVLSCFVGVAVLATPVTAKCSGSDCEYTAYGLGTVMLGEGDVHDDCHNAVWPDKCLASIRAAESVTRRCDRAIGGCPGYTNCEAGNIILQDMETGSGILTAYVSTDCRCSSEEYNEPASVGGRVPAPVPSFFAPIRQFTDWLIGRKVPKTGSRRIGG